MRKSYIFLFSLVFSFSTFAQLPEGINLMKTGDGYLIQLNLPFYETNTVSVDGMNFTNISLKDFGILTTPGRPQLPQITFNLMISDIESEAAVSVLQEDKSLQNIENHIFPYQKPWLKNRPLSERPFDYDKEYYASGEAIQTGITVSEPYVIAGVKGVTVTIYPFAYAPAEKALTAVNFGEYKIKLSQSVTKVSDHSNVYNEYLNKVFANYEYTPSRMLSNYLIITAPEYESSLAGFISHKGSLGYNVALFTTATTGTTASAIKTFIQNRYNDPSTKPEFILLVGDVDKIPAWTGTGAGTPRTDLNYVQLEGSDYFADASIGRFSVTNTTELANAINKTLYMENYIGTLTKKNVFFASTDNYQITEGTHNYVINTYFAPNNYTNLKLYYHSGATTQQSINALNDNQIFAIYSGHGSETSWADGPPLNQSQVSALVNTVYPFVYSFACVTGSFHLAECFGETWLRTEHGASSFYGSSVNSYWDEDDILERALIKALFEDGLTKVTPMFDKGKLYLVNHYGGSVTSGSTMLRYLEMYNLMGDPSLSTQKVVMPDSTAPEAITDLTAGNATSNAITLNWTAPYDSTYGGISSYDIRYAATPITNDDQFNAAARIVLAGQSDSAGTPKSILVQNLTCASTYYFAIKAQDIWNNNSLISNSASTATLDAPAIAITPDSLSKVVITGTTVVDTIWIRNITTTPSTLDYSVEFANNSFPSGFVKARLLPARTSSTDINAYQKDKPAEMPGQSIEGFGGPDLFGYEWIDSDEPSGPVYVWNDISTTGTLATSWQPTGTYDPKDEGYAGPFALGFDFKFYGTVKNQVYVNSNGPILFEAPTSNMFTNAQIPTSSEPNGFIAAFWDDLDGRTQGTVHYKQEGNKFIIQFSNWQKYSATGSLTWQYVIYSSGKIMIYYNNMNATLTSATVGLENMDGTDGLQIAYNAAYVKNNFAVQIAAEPDWLAGSGSLNGTLYNGNSTAIELTFMAEDYQLGNYSMDMVVESNCPTHPIISVPVAMNIQAVPVEMSLFEVTSSKNDAVISWKTVTETNNKGFSIERKTGTKLWEEAGWVNGSGTSAELNEYMFIDKNLTPGNYIYRIKQVDFDGKSDYSREVEVEIGTPDSYVLEQNYPNPFNPATIISYSVPEKAHISIVVYNSLGEVISTLVNGEKEAGYYDVNFNAAGLSSGIYFYRIDAAGTGGKFSSVKKMLLIK